MGKDLSAVVVGGGKGCRGVVDAGWEGIVLQIFSTITVLGARQLAKSGLIDKLRLRNLILECV